MINRISYYFKRILIRIFNYNAVYGPVYLSYLPDSINSYYLTDYKEFIGDFIYSNKLNNNGDLTRLFALILNIRQVLDDGVEGAFAEVGVWRGNTASILNKFAKKFDRHVYLFDTFKGFENKEITDLDKSAIKSQFSDTNIDLVKKVIGLNEKCHLEIGYFPNTIRNIHREIKYSVVSIDCDLYEPIKASLNFFYPRMSNGGIILLHDYSSGHWPGAFKAIKDFFRDKKHNLILIPDKSGSVFVRVYNEQK